MLEENKEIILTGEEAINILKEINYILCSLHDMGSYFYGKGRVDYNGLRISDKNFNSFSLGR